MEIAVWDTYVKREDGQFMHFDILAPKQVENGDQIFEFASLYLSEKGINIGDVEIKKCAFCHIEKASKETLQFIQSRGFDIIEFENCS